jgi:uncharacterized NAD(P)/FAD-binding protein YdhS
MRLKRVAGPQLSDVAIIGGGFSGVCLALELLEQADSSFSVALIERGPCRGRGVAYSTQYPGHLLNVPARNMSALARDPDHFLRWARGNFDSGAQPGDFLSRRLYGDYVESLLSDAIAKHRGQIVWKRNSAISLERRGGVAEIKLDHGETILASKIVLALGNFAPSEIRVSEKVLAGDHFTQNPWLWHAFDRIPTDGEVLLVGSGLTSVDVLLSLRSYGFKGTVHMLSRHGLLPQQHKTTSAWPEFWRPGSPKTARGLLRLVREQVRAAESQGKDLRSVVDALRPATQLIWRSLPLHERARFLRHLQHYWDVHRHRIAPAIGGFLAHQIQSGHLLTHAGRIIDFSETDKGVTITYRERKTQKVQRLQVAHVINCTGPQIDCRKVNSPLVSGLLRRGLVRPDPLYLGIDSTQDGALIDGGGAASNWLFAIGPFRKGTLWESIAVPELREQACSLASLLLCGDDYGDVHPHSNRTGIDQETSAV